MAFTIPVSIPTYPSSFSLIAVLFLFLLYQDQHGISSNRSFDSTHGLPGLANQTNGTAHAHMINNSLYSSDGELIISNHAEIGC